MRYLYISLFLSVFALNTNAQIITTDAVSLYYPNGVAFDAVGNMYISEGNDIRKVTTSGIISMIAGTGTVGFTGDGGQATVAEISSNGVALDSKGNIYIADWQSNRVRKVSTTGIIKTIAGNGTSGYTGDGGQATAAELYQPNGLAVDALGNLFICENNAIRKVNTLGIISTIAGNGAATFGGDGGQAINASINNAYGIALDVFGNLYIADTQNNRIRKVNSAGIISTIVGGSINGYSGDGGQGNCGRNISTIWSCR